MKPPHSSRPGGSSRPPSDRGPYRGPGGYAPRSPGQGSGGPGAGGKRADGRGGYGPKAGDAGHRDHARPRYDGPRPGGKPGAKDSAPRGEFQSRPPRGQFQARPPREEFQARPPRDEIQARPPRDEVQARPPRDEVQARAPRDTAPQRSFAPSPRQRDADSARHAPDVPKGTVWLYGHHAVGAALANPGRRLRRLLLTEEAEAAISQRLPGPWAVSPERVDRGRIDQLLGREVVHQGAALLADTLTPPSLQSVLEKPGVIIVLDQVTDPRNVGAIMRSAAAFGAAAVIVQDRNAPEETGALAKAASGALETLPLLRAVNIARTIIALKAANVWCIGLDASGEALSGPAFADHRVALVLGAEGEGLRRLTRESCDLVAGLTIKAAVESLNVSAAAAIALYELSRR
jgi:23S rRNA (guanosine2251-2'-O)-methyltransferase